MELVNDIASEFKALQNTICTALENADGVGAFEMNAWKKNIGGGVTGVLKDGAKIEKAAVNFSHVKGKFTPQMEKLLGEKANSYQATGVSSIIHPINVHVPIIHMNVRYFEMDNGTCWFGGGIDLTPHYVSKTDAAWFHRQLKTVCDATHPEFYNRFKQWADDYFYLAHRNETRGVGGIFYDRLKPDETLGVDAILKFCIALGNAYPEIYAEMLRRNAHIPVKEEEKEWQNIRRGRYVEFNLVYDRGTKFGLESDGNTESILLSMPPQAAWEYNYVPKAGSREEETLGLLKKGIDWIN